MLTAGDGGMNRFPRVSERYRRFTDVPPPLAIISARRRKNVAHVVGVSEPWCQRDALDDGPAGQRGNSPPASRPPGCL